MALVIGAILFSAGLQTFAAFTQPSTAAPGNDAYAPLHTGITAQSKVGGLLLNTGGGDNGLIVQNGNVGIGTVNPTTKLAVVAPPITSDTEIASFSAPSSPSGIAYATFGGGPGGYVGWDYGAGGIALNAHSAGGSVGGIFVKKVNNGSSNVGIGTLNPDSKLDVAGVLEVGTGSRGAILRSTGADNFRLHTWVNTPNPNFAISAGDGLGGESSTVWIEGESSTLRLMKNGGNVGIGTVSPTTKLNVAGNVGADKYCDQTGANCISAGTGAGGIQQRITGTCNSGTFLIGVNSDGTVSCAAASGGTPTYTCPIHQESINQDGTYSYCQTSCTGQYTISSTCSYETTAYQWPCAGGPWVTLNCDPN